MIVDGAIELKGQLIITGLSTWKDNLQHAPGDILTDGTRQWAVVEVDKIHQGCFDLPRCRYHALKVKPIGHDQMPEMKSVLTKQ